MIDRQQLPKAIPGPNCVQLQYQTTASQPLNGIRGYVEVYSDDTHCD